MFGKKMRTICLTACLTFICIAISGSVFAATLPKEDKVPAIDLWITSLTYDPVRYEIGLLLAEKWKELGFEVKTTAMEWATMSAKGMKGHEHGAFMIQWGGKPERIDPFHWLYTLHKSTESRKGGYNVAGYVNPDYDKLVEKFVSATDQVDRKKAADKCQEILARDVPQPPVVHRVITHAYNSIDFKNAVFAMGEGLNSFWNWMSIEPKGERRDLRFGYVNDIRLLNPLTSKAGADIFMLRMIYDSLVRPGPDGTVVPWAAESFSAIDPTTIEVKLRKGMSFHDGTPVTVEDVKFTFDLAKQVKSPYYLSKIKKLDSVEIKDDATIIFKLTQPYAPFISTGLGTLGILPRHIWQPRFEEKGSDGVLKWHNPSPVGSGPFKFVYWRPNEELKLTAFSSHFQPPKIDSLLRIPYAKAYGVVQGLKSGEVDAAGWSLLPLEQKELKNASHLTMKRIDDFGAYILHYNMRRPPYNDVDVRRALTYAIPKKMIVDLVFEGMAVPAYSIVAPVNTYWHNPEIEKVGDKLDKAREILKQSGFRWDKKGKIYYPKNYSPTAIAP